MATLTRRYGYQGPWPLDLKNATDPTLVLPATNFRVYYDVTWDDAQASIAGMDERMSHYGCFPDPSGTSAPPNGTNVPFLGLKSPDGSIWELSVDNAGVLSTTKRSP
jgi:hypothetical protein